MFDDSDNMGLYKPGGCKNDAVCYPAFRFHVDLNISKESAASLCESVSGYGHVCFIL